MEGSTAIIFNDDLDQILLLKRRDTPVWTLVGGGIEPGESPEETVTREVEEETGLRVKIVRKVANYHPTHPLTRRSHLFQCAVIGGKIQLGEEAKEIAFFPIDELPKQIPPPYPDWIHDTLSGYTFTLEKGQHSVNYRAVIVNLILHPILCIRFFLSRLGIPLNR